MPNGQQGKAIISKGMPIKPRFIPEPGFFSFGGAWESQCGAIAFAIVFPMVRTII
jgi:hypothetical protein